MGDLASDSSSKSTNETVNNQIGQQAAPNSTQLAISGSNGVTVTTADPEVVRGAVDLAHAVANSSANNVTYALGLVQAIQDRAAQSVDKAVSDAQTVALTATPPSPAVLAEISQNQFKQILLAVGGGVLVLLVLKRK